MANIEIKNQIEKNNLSQITWGCFSNEETVSGGLMVIANFGVQHSDVDDEQYRRLYNDYDFKLDYYKPVVIKVSFYHGDHEYKIEHPQLYSHKEIQLITAHLHELDALVENYEREMAQEYIDY